MQTKSKVILWLVVIAVSALAVFIYIRFYYVFGEGVKSGELNYMVRKGYIFKTYEGKMIQSGFQTDGKNGIHSNEFIFSIEDKALADSLMLVYEGKEATLHYKEYLGRLPWRGHSKYIVDGVISLKDKAPTQIPSIPPVAQ